MLEQLTKHLPPHTTKSKVTHANVVSNLQKRICVFASSSMFTKLKQTILQSYLLSDYRSLIITFIRIGPRPTELFGHTQHITSLTP